jgi:hypothetical protein
MERQMAVASGEMYPSGGILTRQRVTRCVVDESSLGSPGNDINEMPSKRKNRRSGADPPKNESGIPSYVNVFR